MEKLISCLTAVLGVHLTFVILSQIGQHDVGAALLVPGVAKQQCHRQMIRIQVFGTQVRLIAWLWIPIESRRLADDRQKCTEIVIVADDVVCEVDFALTRKHLDILRLVEAACALECQKGDGKHRGPGRG